MNVLIVDDSIAMRKILMRIVTSLGFKAIEAGHGVEAMQQLIQHPSIEIALVDWNMPEMNGLEFVKAVRSNAQYTETKLVMVTSETDPTKMARAITAGADEFLMKPFTAEMLLDKLHLIGIQLPRASC